MSNKLTINKELNNERIYNKIIDGYNQGLLIGQRTNTGGITGAEYRTPADGPGGYNTNPYDDFGDYRGPIIPNPNRGLPGQGFDWAHSPMEVDTLADKWGATILPDGKTWMMPTKEGTLRPATDEEAGMLDADFQHRQMYNRNQPHPHLADAKALTDTLSPYQNPRSGSLRDSGLSDEQKRNLLIQGVGAHKAQ